MATETDSLQQIGKNAMECIAEMVAALECDYERLAELQNERDGCENFAEYDVTELAELTAAAGDCTSYDDALERIMEDPLSLLVRSGWHSPGEDSEPEEYELLLTTGGPAVRIRGELEDGEPTRAYLQVQDWGTPWTDYIGQDCEVLLAYVRCFYFGE